jgi:hypothetical protein
MKCLKRNMTKFEYLPHTGLETDVNEDGEHTGEFHPQYGNAVEKEGNISSPSGQTSQQFYGQDIRYTHTLVMDDPNVDFNELGLIRWNGELYNIVAIRPSLNAVSIALRKQTMNHATAEELPDTDDEDEPAETSETDGEDD